MASSNACWGIEIGAGAVKAVKLVVEAEELKVAEFAFIPHPRVLSTPDTDPDDAKRVALGRLVSEYDLSKATIAVSVPGHSAFARFAKLPPVEPKKVPDIVKFEAVQQIPVPLDEVEWDYQTFVSPDSPDVEVGIFAITKQRIASELAILHDVNLTPDVVTLSPVAVYNAIAHDLQFTETSPGTILLDVGTTSTDLVIAEAGRVWVRTFPIGGHEFTNALVEAFKLSYPKAEKLKREAETSKHARHVFQALRPVFSDLVQDVQRSIGYYQSMHRGANLERLVGMGSTFQLPGLRKYLKQQLGMNVYRLENFKRLSSEGPHAAEFAAHTLNFATAYGLALQGLGLATLQANLMPLEVAKQAMWAGKGKWFAAAAGISLAATGAMFIRPFLDQQALSIPEPAKILDASRTADQLTNEAREAGVTEDVTQGEQIAKLMQLYEGREAHLRLLADVDAMLTESQRAAEQKGQGSGFELQSMQTDFLHGAMSNPSFGGAGGRGGRGSRATSAAVSEESSLPPELRGQMMDERMSRGGMYGGEGGEGGFVGEGGAVGGAPATGVQGPRVAVTLELSTTQPLVEVFVEQQVKRWLEQHAERDGVPYYYNIEKFEWKPLYQIDYDQLAAQRAEAAGQGRGNPRQPAGGRAEGGRAGSRYAPEGEGEFAGEGGGFNERIGRGFGEDPGAGYTGGDPKLPQDAAQALGQLNQLAPIAEPAEAARAAGTIESFIMVSFEAVLGQKAAEDEEGDE
ncbi:MAG: type IV pilus assembly protein PilM [Phycisphaerales bacterium]|nr:type IV pilus assembly protein PilM [Phycisphaerales bacterium]